MEQPLQLDLIFSALGDSTRRDILTRLVEGDRTVGEIAQKYKMSLPAVSKHVAILEKSGLITIAKQGRTKTASLEFSALQFAQIWLEAIDDGASIWTQIELDVEKLG